MNSNTKKIEDDAGYSTFFVGDMAFSIICKRNEVIGYILGLEVAWGNLLMKVMDGSAIKARGIYYWKMWASTQVADEVLDSFEKWF